MLLQMAKFIFHWLSSVPLWYIYVYFFIHSSVDGHLGYSHTLAIVKNAAIIFGIYVYFPISIILLFFMGLIIKTWDGAF